MKAPPRRLALFDLDHTLISADTDELWIQHLGEAGALDAAEHAEKSKSYMEQYHAGTLDIHEFLSHRLAVLGQHPRARLEAWRDECFRARQKKRIGPKARMAVERHANAGDMLILITATCSFVALPAALDLGFEHIIGTLADTRTDGSFTGKSKGTPAFREGKIVRLEEYLHDRGQRRSDFSEVWFYSDSRNDIPLLELATHPIAIDPDPVLLEHALKRKWRIDSFKIAS